MYLVQIKNGQDLITINDITTGGNNRITGEINQGINTIDSFTFSIYPNNIGYDKIQPLKTNVSVYNTKTGEYEFRGRVLMSENKMDSSGLIYKRVTTESDLGFLHDTYTRYKTYEGVTTSEFLKEILENHNNQVEEDKRFYVGNVEIHDFIYREVAYISTWESLKTRLFENSNLGGEISVRYEGGIRYIDYVKERGSIIVSSPIRLASNMISLNNEDDFEGFCTRLIPLGAKLQDSEERVSISSVNNGNDYIDDVDGINKYGIISKVVTWDDVNTPSILLSRGRDYLANDNIITRKFSIDAVDLSLLNLNPSSYQVGNYYSVINELMGINEVLRVVEKRFSIENPENATLTFGSLFDNIQDYNKTIRQMSIEAREIVNILNNQVDTNNTVINNINTTVNNQQTQINTNTNEIVNQVTNISNLQTTVTGMRSEIDQVYSELDIIVEEIGEINDKVDNTNARVDEINSKMNRSLKRIMMEVF